MARISDMVSTRTGRVVKERTTGRPLEEIAAESKAKAEVQKAKAKAAKAEKERIGREKLARMQEPRTRSRKPGKFRTGTP